MRERPILRLKDASSAEIERDIVSADFISAEKVRAYARQIAQQIQSLNQWNDSATYVIDALTVSKIAELVGLVSPNDDGEVVRDEQIKEVLEPIRKRVLAELSHYLDPDQYFLIKEKIGQTNRNMIHVVEGHPRQQPKILREVASPEQINHDIEIDVEALQRFEQLDKHPAFVDISLYDPRLGKMVCEKLDLITLEEVFDQKELRLKYSFEELLGILLHLMEGALFLAKNNLMMEDISLKNSGIDQKTQKGIFFDIEGLAVLGKKSRFRKHGQLRLPPELNSEIQNVARTEKEMVFQFGALLEDIWARKSLGFPDLYIDALQDIMTQMAQKNPANRLTLQSAYNRLQKMKKDLKREKEQISKAPKRLF